MVAGRNSMLTLLYPPLPSSTLLYLPLPSSILHHSPPLPALQNVVIFALDLLPAHLLPYFKYSLQNCPAVLTPREVPWMTG